MLYERMMEPFIIMEKKKVSDGEGGFITSWEEGLTINLALSSNTSMQARIAEHEGVTSTCTLTSYKNVELSFHDVVKRISDGLVFRVTSIEGLETSPNFSSIDMNQVTAERWEIPNE